MADQVIYVQPGEERVIRIRCGVPPAPGDENQGIAVAPAPPAPGEINQGIIEPPAGAENSIPPAPAEEEIISPEPAPRGVPVESLEGINRNNMVSRKSRKNRKNNGATRKNRKQSGGNSYMNFAKVERKRVLSEHPEMKSRVVDVAKEIGKRWRALSESERKKY